LAALIDAYAVRHDLQEAGAGAPSVRVRPEPRGAAVAHVPARVQHAAAVALAAGPPPRRVGSADGGLVEDHRLRAGGVELGDRVADPEARPRAEHAAGVERGVPLLVGAPAARGGQKPPRATRLRSGAVRD